MSESVKSKHHYVPKFLLRNFSSSSLSEKKAIHQYNIAHRRAISHSSLRNQCYKHKFHGDTDELEDHLARLESEFAPVIGRIIDSATLPRPSTEEWGLLLFFIAFQVTRTHQQAERVNESMDKVMKQAMSHDLRFQNGGLDNIRIRYERPVIHSMARVPLMVECIADLRMKLIYSKQSGFILSDDPVCKYNQFYEGTEGHSQTGGVSRGLQIFLPLSPKHLLFLYDRTVYMVKNSTNSVVYELTDQDVAALNLFQAVNAEENLYFHDWDMATAVERLVNRAAPHRRESPVRVAEYEEGAVDNDSGMKGSLIHLYEQSPNLRLRLSFVGLTKQARQAAHKKFSYDYMLRKIPPSSPGDGAQAGPDGSVNRIQHFVVPHGRRRNNR